jgi:hypothetical protein
MVVMREEKNNLNAKQGRRPACFSNSFSEIARAWQRRSGCHAVNDAVRKSLRGHGVANHYRGVCERSSEST